MSFLSPTAIAVAAGLTIPPLIALYFLKLKRVVRPVPTTLLWRRSVEDLQVNAPFQRLRSSLLLLLQLLILIAVALALGQPMLQTARMTEGTIIILIDQSASMNVVEADGRSRLEQAKEQAKRCVDNMDDDARAMVIAFADRAAVVSSFDTDKQALKRRIDAIQPTQSSSSLSEAVSLAEAYTQNIIIGTDSAGSDKAPESAAPPASVFLFTDGRIQQADRVTVQRLDMDKIQVTIVGSRGDNAGITAMDARRSYERPEVLDVTATVRNFSAKPVALDAVLTVDGQTVDVQPVRLQAAEPVSAPGGGGPTEPAKGSVHVVPFDPIDFEGGGVVDVALRVDDALSADDRAWTIIEPFRHVRVLLVTQDNPFLEEVLKTLPLKLVRMTGAEYEDAPDKALLEGQRSAFDVVILDRHATARLPLGNYFFWGAVPRIDGVAAGRTINDQVIFNWDDTHPILRHVALESLWVDEWLELKLPPEAVSLVDGETSPVLAYFTRDASQFLISAFSLIVDDPVRGPLRNTFWMASADFVVFIQNAIQYLSSNVAVAGRRSVVPGEPVTLPLPKTLDHVDIERPDGVTERVTSTGLQQVYYTHTRRVGPYRVKPGVPGHDGFAVNLFNPEESRVEPARRLTIGSAAVKTQATAVSVNEPAWPYLLLLVLVLLLFEWVVYNRRVYV